MPNLGPNQGKNQFGQIIKIIPGQMDLMNLNRKFLADWESSKDFIKTLRSGSKNINQNNMFNSPDSLVFNSRGDLFIQTDEIMMLMNFLVW